MNRLRGYDKLFCLILIGVVSLMTLACTRVIFLL
jgi:hypothetical protein